MNSTKDKIIEISALKINNGAIIDEFNTFINPQVSIPEDISKLTNITNDDVKCSPTIADILETFLEFIGDSVLVAHNAEFDVGFLKINAKK
ncbi:DNA polymerase III PolC [Clostridium scatologenes]|uniref:DNA polymerase III PolC n=1 Tax=Clostridium scatologenes TaxID=1548 RepID=A0A0E3JLW2_CLOSL|nr:DNA polymerase III PolC [Clostridium scatologenes]